MHLAHRVARQVRHHNGRLGLLEPRQIARDGRQGCVRVNQAHQHREHRLAEIGVRQADHGAFGDAGDGVQQHLDLFGIDVVTAGDDQILGAADDGDIAVCVDLPQITGDEPAVGAQILGGFVGHLPVAGKDVRAAHLDHAIHQPQFHPRQRKADRAGPPRAVIGV